MDESEIFFQSGLCAIVPAMFPTGKFRRRLKVVRRSIQHGEFLFSLSQTDTGRWLAMTMKAKGMNRLTEQPKKIAALPLFTISAERKFEKTLFFNFIDEICIKRRLLYFKLLLLISRTPTNQPIHLNSPFKKRPIIGLPFSSNRSSKKNFRKPKKKKKKGKKIHEETTTILLNECKRTTTTEEEKKFFSIS